MDSLASKIHANLDLKSSVLLRVSPCLFFLHVLHGMAGAIGVSNFLRAFCDRSGQPVDTQGVFVVKGETSRSHEIDEIGFHEKLCAADRSGQLEITLSVIEARNLSENTRVEQTHDGSGQLDECNSSSAHTVKEQHAPDEHREIASFNTNN